MVRETESTIEDTHCSVHLSRSSSPATPFSSPSPLVGTTPPVSPCTIPRSPFSTPIQSSIVPELVWDKKHLLKCWNEVSNAIDKSVRVAIFLDYDGTLTPIVSDPMRAKLSDEARDTLAAVSRSFPTALVSGRRITTLRKFVALPPSTAPLWLAGSHGLEVAAPDGSPMAAPAVTFVPALRSAIAFLRAQLERLKIVGASVEDNDFTISAHYRNVAPERLCDVQQAVQATLDCHPALALHHGSQVFELRPKIPWNKGHAILFLLGNFFSNVASHHSIPTPTPTFGPSNFSPISPSSSASSSTFSSPAAPPVSNSSTFDDHDSFLTPPINLQQDFGDLHSFFSNTTLSVPASPASSLSSPSLPSPKAGPYPVSTTSPTSASTATSSPSPSPSPSSSSSRSPGSGSIDVSDALATLSCISNPALLPRDILPIYIGDDVTDEDAFGALRSLESRGISPLAIHVRSAPTPPSVSSTPSSRPTVTHTKANYVLDSPNEVIQFLSLLCRDFGPKPAAVRSSAHL